jgi:hypothetical protein
VAWENSSTFLKIISCPPKYEFAPQMPPPPNSEAWRGGVRGFIVAKSKFYPEISGFFEAVGIIFLFFERKGKFEIYRFFW